MPVAFPGTDPITGTTAVVNGTTTRSYASSQFGQYQISALNWTEPFARIGVGDDFYGGVRFDLYSLDPDRGLPLTPRTFTNFKLQVTTNIDLAPPNRTGDLEVYIVPEVNPDPYSDSIPPFSRSESSHLLVSTSIPTTNPATTYTMQLDSDVMSDYVTDQSWTGRIALSLAFTNPVPAGFLELDGKVSGTFPPMLVVEEFPFHTGDSTRWRDRTRAVHDYTMGYPTLSDEFVPDGYLEGTLVHEDSWDPRDPGPTYVPPPGEGIATDEVVDIED